MGWSNYDMIVSKKVISNTDQNKNLYFTCKNNLSKKLKYIDIYGDFFNLI